MAKVKSSASKAAPVKTVSEKPSNLFRKLSDVILVNSEEFGRTSPSAQTKLLTENVGLPVQFVANFLDLANRRLIRDKMLAGKDVTRELEFNGVTLTEEDRRVLGLVKPILAKIEAIGPVYPWLASALIEAAGNSITFKKEGTSERITRSGHYVTKAAAQAVWKRASKFWGGGKRPANAEVKADGAYYANKTCSILQTGVTIGCQTISRAEVEFIARHYNWEPELETA